MPNTKAMTRYADYQKFNFFREPQWRWTRVLALVQQREDGRAGRSSSRDDKYIQTAREFLLRMGNSRGQTKLDLIWAEHPGLFYAYDLYEKAQEDPEAAMFIEARLLANQTFEQIADAIGITPSTVEWYEALFFNVKDKLRHRDWITKQVLLPAMRRSHTPAGGQNDGMTVLSRDSTVARPFLDGSLKLFGYFGGNHVIDVMITGFQSGKPVQSPDAVQGWFDAGWAMTVRRRSHQAALQFEVNKYNVMELFAVHTRIIEIDRSEESQDSVRNEHERTIFALINDIPWAVGDDGAKLFEGKPLGKYDEGAAELRDDEVIKVGAGQLIDDNFPKALPPPRKRVAATMTKSTDDL